MTLFYPTPVKRTRKKGPQDLGGPFWISIGLDLYRFALSGFSIAICVDFPLQLSPDTLAHDEGRESLNQFRVQRDLGSLEHLGYGASDLGLVGQLIELRLINVRNL